MSTSPRIAPALTLDGYSSVTIVAALLVLMFAATDEPVRGWVTVGQITVQVSWLDSQLGEVRCYDASAEQVVDLVRDWEGVAVWPIEMLRRQGIVWGGGDVITGIPAPRPAVWTTYPNPTTGTIQFIAAAGGRLEIYDVIGRRVMPALNIDAGAHRINFDLPAGVYVIRFAGTSRKLVIVK